jgi:hypothetical protein
MSEFEFFMLEKINSSRHMERDMNEAILSLYQQGYLDVQMRDDGEPLITTYDEYDFFIHFSPTNRRSIDCKTFAREDNYGPI